MQYCRFDCEILSPVQIQTQNFVMAGRRLFSKRTFRDRSSLFELVLKMRILKVVHFGNGLSTVSLATKRLRGATRSESAATVNEPTSERQTAFAETKINDRPVFGHSIYSKG